MAKKPTKFAKLCSARTTIITAHRRTRTISILFPTKEWPRDRSQRNAVVFQAGQQNNPIKPRKHRQRSISITRRSDGRLIVRDQTRAGNERLGRLSTARSSRPRILINTKPRSQPGTSTDRDTLNRIRAAWRFRRAGTKNNDDNDPRGITCNCFDAPGLRLA